MRDRTRTALGIAAIVWANPRAALAHSGHCTSADLRTTLGIGAFLGLLLFRPWRTPVLVGAPSRTRTTKLTRWTVPFALAGALTLGGCGGGGSSSAVRPPTDARLEIVNPVPNQTVGPDFTLSMNLVGASIVPATVTGGPLRGTEGHIHVTLDGKLISMAYGTSQDMKGIGPGPHNLQAEFVATDHAPFANRVIVAVAFQVAAPQGSPS